MDYKLITNEELAGMEFDEKFGMINLYSCPNCRHFTVYLFLADGVTPHVITCVKCGSDAYSQKSAVRQPTIVWYRPKDLDELRTLTDMAYEATKGEYGDELETVTKAKILYNYIEHYNAGGLFATGIEKARL